MGVSNAILNPLYANIPRQRDGEKKKKSDNE